VDPEKTKYILMSNSQKIGRKHSINVANRSLKMWQSSNNSEKH
jgi:hypothetical protein